MIGIILFLINSGLVQNLKPIDWYKEFNSRWPDPISHSSALGWGEAYTIRAYISMYRASVARGEPEQESQKWWDRLIDHCDYVVDSKLRESSLVEEGHGFTPIAWCIYLIFSSDSLYSLYQDKANKYLYYLENEVIPSWRGCEYWKTPHNWYTAYGSLLLLLWKISHSKYYHPPYYNSPDPTLSEYYRDTVEDIASNWFQDFGNWEYTGAGWHDAPYPEKKGLCYCPSIDAYVWRYMDYRGEFLAWGFDSENNIWALSTTTIDSLDKWYKILLTHYGDTISLEIYDSDGTTLLWRGSTQGKIGPSGGGLWLGSRPEIGSFFVGLLDEVKIERGGNLIAYWKFDGNAKDASGNGRDGVIYGTPEWVEGKEGRALRFSGDDYVMVPSSPEIQDFNKISMWIKFEELSDRRYCILSKGEHLHYGPGGYHIHISCYKRPEDDHSNIEVEFVNFAHHDYQFSQFYPYEKLLRFANTMLKVIWSNSDSIHPTFRSHLDPSGEYGDEDAPFVSMRWLWLYEFKPEIGGLISRWYENHPQDLWAEAVANLACWQAGLYLMGIEEERKPLSPRPLLKVYPNPFSKNIRISSPTKGILRIYDISARLIQVLPLKGSSVILWDGRDKAGKRVPKGLYFFELKGKRYRMIKKVIKIG